MLPTLITPGSAIELSTMDIDALNLLISFPEPEACFSPRHCTLRACGNAVIGSFSNMIPEVRGNGLVERSVHSIAAFA